jgi:hypothetical protein
MAIVTEISWDDMLDGKPLPETPARKAWRDAVAEIAEKAKATLPECNGRVDKAVAIVLNGDVELLPDGKAKVASQSNGTTQYFVVNGECQCKDFPTAPSGWCKHRIAAGMAKRAYPLAKAKLEAATAPQNGHTEPQPVSAPPPGEPVLALPEAPASANVHVTLAGRKVQVTLRDSDEQRLLIRLEALLKRFPAEEEPEGEQASPEGWCSKHGVQMKLRNGAHGAWWSHHTAAGWCKGK